MFQKKEWKVKNIIKKSTVTGNEKCVMRDRNSMENYTSSSSLKHFTLFKVIEHSFNNKILNLIFLRKRRDGKVFLL